MDYTLMYVYYKPMGNIFNFCCHTSKPKNSMWCAGILGMLHGTFSTNKTCMRTIKYSRIEFYVYNILTVIILEYSLYPKEKTIK